MQGFARRGFVALAAGISALGSCPAAAASGTDPVADAQGRLDQARAEAHAAAARYQSTLAERAQTESEIAILEATIPRLQERRAELEQIIATRAAALYRNTDPVAGFDLTADVDVNAPARRARLTESATDHDTEIAEELNATTAKLELAEADLQRWRAELDALLPRLDAERADFDAKVQQAETALWRATVVGALRARGATPLLGPSALSAADIAAWFRSTGARARVEVPIEELTAIYVEEGLAEGVRGDIAFAQSIVETGSFSAVGPNNFAGLGACDSCATMTSFPTVRDGVRAQIQHLKNYGDPTSTAAGLHNPPSPWWYGEGATGVRNFDTFFAKGWAQTWEEMGAGNWATDPTYAGKVLAVYDRMLAHGT